ncbi:hypothetical protein LCGC14_0109370 [marine sediment metagenome]|uniref:Uncharacterized protein n=1 Tax=marine sediment metagenome TaxID=412755 RepID=A0A0F9VDE4_9ZZZZ
MVIVMKCYDQKPLELIGRNQTHGNRKAKRYKDLDAFDSSSSTSL